MLRNLCFDARVARVSLALMGTLTSASVAHGQDWTLSASLARSAGPADDSFGAALGVSRDSIVVGASTESAQTVGGAAYVFSGAGWSNVARLVPEEAEPNGTFGGSVSLDEDTAFIGTSKLDQGAVYVFVRDPLTATWAQKQRIIESSRTFGYRVAQRGNMALIGAPKDGPDVGRVHVYVKTGEYAKPSAGDAGASDAGAVAAPPAWTESQELTAIDAMYSDFFGLALAFDGVHAVVGAPGNAVAQSTRAGAYVFSLDAGKLTQRARLSVAGPPAIHFGSSVAVNGGTVVVGAPPGSGMANNGQAFVYVSNGVDWVLEQALGMPTEESFGETVEVQGNILVVSARTANEASAYVFEREAGVWLQKKRIVLPSMEYGTGSLALGGGTLVIGHPHDGELGGVQVFRNPVHDPPPETPPTSQTPADGPEATPAALSPAGSGCSASRARGRSSLSALAVGLAALALSGRARARLRRGRRRAIVNASS